MKQYLVKIYSSKNSTAHVVSDIVSGDNINEVEKSLIGKIYYRDSYEKNILCICRKAEVVHEIV